MNLRETKVCLAGCLTRTLKRTAYELNNGFNKILGVGTRVGCFSKCIAKRTLT